MVCQMELSSHLLTNSVFDSVAVNEMVLAEGLDGSLAVFGRSAPKPPLFVIVPGTALRRELSGAQGFEGLAENALVGTAAGEQ